MLALIIVFLVCCCYCWCCRNLRRHYQVSLEFCDGCCCTIQIVSKRRVSCDRPVLQERKPSSLPNNFHNFITAIIIPSFEKQRLTSYQFAVVVLLSEKDLNNICGMKFIPSYEGWPILDKHHPSMPKSAINYIAAHPSSDGCLSLEEYFGKYSSINSPFRLQLKYTGLCIVYVHVPFWHVLLMVPSRWRTRRIEDNGRLENESRDIEDCSTKGWKMTG